MNTIDRVGMDAHPQGWVSTVGIDSNDGCGMCYETVIRRYGADIRIVDSYDTREQAVAGHAKWLATLNATAGLG